MTKEEKARKQPYVVAVAGIVIACGLIGLGIVSGNKNVSEISINKEINLENKKKLTEDEQLALKPIVDLVNSVKNRFEDEISKKRAEVTTRLLIKEFVNSHATNEIENWGVFISNVTMEDLKKWNESQEEKFKTELKNMSENKEIKNVPVEEIAQNNPLYILQEKKIIQRELYEQWVLANKKENKLDNTSANNVSIDGSVEKSTNTDAELIIDISKETNIDNDKSKTDLKNVNPADNGAKILIPINPVANGVNNSSVENVDKSKTEESNKKINDLQKITQELEKAKSMEKDLALKKTQLNEELNKNNQNLKEIEEEIEKTRKELDKLEKEIKK